MVFEKMITAQFACPKGILSSFAARAMNKLTADLNDMAIELLDIKPEDYVLDIGFGGGIGIEKTTELATDGMVAGIDISRAMLRQGRRKFRRLIAQGKVEIKEGSDSQIPYPDNCFDKIYTVNTVYFWPVPLAGMKDIFRVIKKQGIVVLVYTAKAALKSTHHTHHSEDYLCDLFKQAGFTDIQTLHREHPRFTPVCIVATKK